VTQSSRPGVGDDRGHYIRANESVTLVYISSMVAPVVLIAFNRPEQTKRNLDRIREAAPQDLFLIVDAPRTTHPKDAELNAAVRAELEKIDWPCNVRRLYAESNLGCAANIELGLDWVFGQVESAIILEDDCLADPTFFTFCSELLEKYADDNRIAYIGGAAPELPAEVFEGASYAFTAFASIWGWATWKRAWQAHREIYPRTHAGGDHTSIRTEPIDWSNTLLQSPSGRRFFKTAGAVTDKQSATWAIHWCLSVIASRSLTITAANVLVKNIGFGEAGTHTQSVRVMAEPEPMEFPLTHPESIEINRTVELAYEKVVAQELGLIARVARKVLPAGPVRALVRNLHYRRTAPTRS
jgi:hypothetical protein